MSGDSVKDPWKELGTTFYCPFYEISVITLFRRVRYEKKPEWRI